MLKQPSFLERIGSGVTRMFEAPQKRDLEGVMFQELMTLGGRMSGVAGPAIKARTGAMTLTTNPWVFGALSAIVNEAADIPIYIRKKVRSDKNRDGTWKYEYQRIEEHQAIDLMQHPMGQAELNGQNYMNGDLFTRTSMFFFLASGEFLWQINSRIFKQIPTELEMLYPHATEIRMNRTTGLIESYVNYEDGKNEFIDPRDVVHVKMPNTVNFYRGLSQLMAANVPIETDKASDSWLWNWFKNNALPDAYIHRDTRPKEGEVERFKLAWDEEHKGTDKAGKLGVVWGGELKELGRSQRDMQFKELKEYNRDTILASLRTSSAALGMMEDANRASVEAFDYAFAKHVVKPFLTMYCKQLTSEFLNRFPNTTGMEFWFDNVVPDDLVNKTTVWGGLLDRGAVSINETRKEFGLDPRPEKEADSLLVGIGKVPIEDITSVDDGTGEDMPDEEDDGTINIDESTE